MILRNSLWPLPLLPNFPRHNWQFLGPSAQRSSRRTLGCPSREYTCFTQPAPQKRLFETQPSPHKPMKLVNMLQSRKNNISERHFSSDKEPIAGILPLLMSIGIKFACQAKLRTASLSKWLPPCSNTISILFCSECVSGKCLS